MSNPNRTIVSVDSALERFHRGLRAETLIVLDCGHERQPNPIYTYKVGAAYRCYVCEFGAE